MKLDKKWLSAAIVFLFLSIGALCTITGCETVRGLYDSNGIVFDSTIRIAADKLINHDESGPDVERAQRMESIASNLKRLSGEEQAPISVIQQEITAQINWDNLSPDEQILVRELIELVAAEVQSRINLGELPEDYTFLTSHVADLILQVTSRYTE